MDKEKWFKTTAWRCSFEEYQQFDCTQCDRHCIHEGAYRRVPEVDGGLALCPKLQEFYKKQKDEG